MTINNVLFPTGPLQLITAYKVSNPFNRFAMFSMKTTHAAHNTLLHILSSPIWGDIAELKKQTDQINKALLRPDIKITYQQDAILAKNLEEKKLKQQENLQMFFVLMVNMVIYSARDIRCQWNNGITAKLLSNKIEFLAAKNKPQVVVFEWRIYPKDDESPAFSIFYKDLLGNRYKIDVN